MFKQELPLMFPDFTEADLAAAIHAFRARQRRFGGLPDQAADAAPMRQRRTC